MAKKTFEDSMNQLEKIVEELETGDLPLEKALKKFEEGMTLSKSCFEKLDETEKKVNLIMENQDGSVRSTPFENDTETEGPANADEK